ncbi:hypothetical protein OnM2_044083 [Erysiphe neolycopersici]|uniref:C2H2-type domain-containing protein n=1 Tax=Erysiphe neolycopersici TaxID=212602 RepID=A0A420HUP9_9PEZI|nr:hypothetical protein OnM2_044083 [Erysiphe neolycopersici]
MSPGVALERLQRLKHTVGDVRRRKDPEDFLQSIVLPGRSAGIADSEYVHILTAHRHLSAELRIHIPTPTPKTNLTTYIKQLTDKKSHWIVYDERQTGTNPPRRNHLQSRNDKFQRKDQGAYNTDPVSHEEKEKVSYSDDECAASDPYNSIYYQGHVHAHNFQPVQEQHRPYQPELKAYETVSKTNCQTIKSSKSPPKVQNTLKNIIKHTDKKCLICDTFFTSNNKLHIHLRSEHPKSRLTSSIKPSNSTKSDKVMPVQERNDSISHPHVVILTAAPSSAPPWLLLQL